MKTVAELRKLDQKGLNTELKAAQRDLFKYKFEVHNSESKNIHQIGNYRKYVAQIRTIQREKQQIEAQAPQTEEKVLEKAA